MRINSSSPNSSSISMRHVSQNDREQKSKLEKLASGKRINHASDDAAGLAISSKLRLKSRSLAAAQNNAQQGLVFSEVASSAMSTISENIIRMRELTIQSLNDTYGDSERDMIQKEFKALKDEIQRIGQSTKYLDNKILNGGKKKIEIQVGFRNGDDNKLSIEVPDLAATVRSLGLTRTGVDNKIDAKRTLPRLDFALNDISKSQAYFGALSQRLKSVMANLSISENASESAKSQILDADYAKETAEKVAADLKLGMSTNAIKEKTKTNKNYISKIVG